MRQNQDSVTMRMPVRINDSGGPSVFTPNPGTVNTPVGPVLLYNTWSLITRSGPGFLLHMWFMNARSGPGFLLHMWFMNARSGPGFLLHMWFMNARSGPRIFASHVVYEREERTWILLKMRVAKRWSANAVKKFPNKYTLIMRQMSTFFMLISPNENC